MTLAHLALEKVEVPAGKINAALRTGK